MRNNYINNMMKNSIKAEAVWGESYDVLWKIIKSKKFKLGAEIGVAYGGHSERILEKTKVKLFSIDPYQELKNYDDPINISNENFELMYIFAKKRLSKFGNRSVLIRKTSKNASKQIDCVDFVYIDANHSYEGITDDLSIWFEKIKSGGIISGHDYGHPNFPGIKKAVDEFFAGFDWKINTHPSGVWWVEKKPISISFIMPAYNAEKTIKESIESIYNGNFSKGDEVIVVDDASNDQTVEVVKKLVKKYENLRLIKHSVNKGGGAARNTAVLNAKNDLIFCLDSDNILEPKSVEKLKQYLISNSADAASFKEVRYFNKTRKNTTHSWKFDKNKYFFHDYLSTFQVPGASGNYLYTKQSFQEAEGYPEFAGALDAWGFGLRQVGENQIVITMPNSYYMHRIGHESYWTRESKKRNTSLIALKIIWPYFNKIIFRDRLYVLTVGLRKWFANLPERPIKTKGK